MGIGNLGVSLDHCCSEQRAIAVNATRKQQVGLHWKCMGALYHQIRDENSPDDCLQLCQHHGWNVYRKWTGMLFSVSARTLFV